MLVARREPDEAWFGWSAGLQSTGSTHMRALAAGYHLTGLHRELLTRLGRGNEAIEAAWRTFENIPASTATTNS